jgi:SAM-dependent methyltransferase
VTWIAESELERFFTERFATPAFFEAASEQVERFTQADPMEVYADLLAFAAGYMKGHHERRPKTPWQPNLIHLGSGKDYKTGWLNLDVIDRAQPDLLLDLAKPLDLPLRAHSDTVGDVVLDEGCADVVHANNVLEHVPDLVTLMGNGLRLLKTGGEFQIEVPYERALTAWQDPTHVRALNENSWIYYTEWFWYLGWFEHRFEVASSTYLDTQLKPCQQEQAAFMRVTLKKVETTLRERMKARTMQPELRLPEDDVFGGAARVADDGEDDAQLPAWAA